MSIHAPQALGLQFLAALALTIGSAVAAFAHATLEVGSTAPGGYKAVMRIPHGCDGKPTDTVRIDLPEGFIGAKPMPKAGWTVAIEKGPYARAYDYYGHEMKEGARAIIWSGGSLADDNYDEFVISGMIAADPGQTLHFVTTQHCGGASIAWTEIPADGQDPHALKHPAPGLTILAGDGGQGAHNHAAAPADDGAAIMHLLKAQFDRPEAPLSVAPIVVMADWAIAGWAQDGKGGRALLAKKGGEWKIRLCTGAAAKEAANLAQMGVPEEHAAHLAMMLAEAEAALDPKLPALFDSFEGTLMIEGDGHDGHGGGHDSHGQGG